VRYQLAFTLGEWEDKRAGAALVALAESKEDAEQVRVAVLSSAVPHVKTMLQAVVHGPSEAPMQFLGELFGLAVALKRDDDLVEPLHALSVRTGSSYAAWQLGGLAGLLDGVERQHRSLSGFEAEASAQLKEGIAQLASLFAAARQFALSADTSEGDRIAAIRVLGRGLSGQDEDQVVLAGLLRPQWPEVVQKAALANLARRRDAEVAGLLLSGWRSYEPNLRVDVLNVLLSRAAWTEQLLDALELGNINPAQISTPNQQKMLGHSQVAIRERAQKLFTRSGDRRQLLKQYAQVLESTAQVLESTGEATKGAALFRQNCATCHRLHDEGFAVGPDLGALTSKSPQTLLIAILDPNQAVETRYLNYNATTKSDREISGIIVAETPSSVTLRSAGGAEEIILRTDLLELTSSGLSLMPEGFEKVMSPQDLTDLIAFLTQPN
jgi:putative heme-binding domain-containing protein